LSGDLIIQAKKKQPWYTQAMLKAGMTAVEMGATAGIKNPIANIWVQTVSGTYFDTQPLSVVGYVSSKAVEVSGYDNTWF
jgi:hypothetical protein